MALIVSAEGSSRDNRVVERLGNCERHLSIALIGIVHSTYSADRRRLGVGRFNTEGRERVIPVTMHKLQQVG